MIGSIRGKIINFEGMLLTIECQSGVGYEVEVTANLLTKFNLQDEVFLYICHIVREDASLLYGFDSIEGRTLFKEIIKVNGLGPRAAMAALSTFSVDDFVAAITKEQGNSLLKIPGVGKKTAERMIVELKDRLTKLNLVNNTQVLSNKVQAEDNFVLEEALGALVGLGYKESIALNHIKQVYIEGMDTRTVIVKALASLSRSK